MIKIINSHGVGMWFQDDIRKILEAIAQAQAWSIGAASTDIANAYRAGQANTLQVVAAAFGLKAQAEAV